MYVEEVEFTRLTTAQRAAWRHIGEPVNRYQAKTRANVAQVLADCGCSETLCDSAIESVRQHARVVLHVHPDRVGVVPVTVAEGLLEHLKPLWHVLVQYGEPWVPAETPASSWRLQPTAAGAIMSRPRLER